MPVILASASPRRHELLKQIVNDFLIVPTNIDEDAMTTSDPIVTAETLAYEKARAVPAGYENPVIIGCDTVVALRTSPGSQAHRPLLEGEAIGWAQYANPVDRDDAIRILKELRGRTHQVITGVAILTPTASIVGHCVTDVTFHDVSDQQIIDYVDTGEPMDKAGAYGAQGMGSFLIARLDGPFDNVVGLPIELTRSLLRTVG